MATKKSYQSNRAEGRRPFDSIDSLRPSSLPPELGSLDMAWDDDPRCVGAIDLLQNHDLQDIDVDVGERTTSIPDIPIDQLVQATMAEADARESAEASQTSGVPPKPPDQTGGPHGPGGTSRPGPDLVPQPSVRQDPGRLGRPSSLDLASTTPVRFGTSRSASPPENRVTVPPTARPTDRDSLRHEMKDRYATGDFTGALELSEALLEVDTEDLEARRFAASCRDVLTQMLTSHIGSFEQYVEVSLTPEELRWLTLDHRAGFFLSLVDGSSTIEELLDISGMARLESLRILTALIDQRVLRIVNR